MGVSTIAEIEAAIQSLPSSQVEELATCLQAHRSQRGVMKQVEKWLPQARGAAVEGVTTERVISATRGEE